MTGKELIDAIMKNHLEDCEVIPRDIFDPNNGDYLRFFCPDKDTDYRVLWLTDDYLQDVVYNHAGEVTYGIFSTAEKEFYRPEIVSTKTF